MAPENRCPVCRIEHIPDDRDRCPQCDADLTCFKVLETLREPAVEKAESAVQVIDPPATRTVSKPGAPFWAISGLLWGVVMILLGLQIYRISGLQADIAQQQTGFNDAVRRIEVKLGRIPGHQDKILSEVTTQMENFRARLERFKIPPAVAETGSPPDESDSVLIAVEAPAKASDADDRDLSTPDKATADRNAYHIYQVRENDTLWDIAERFYGSGFFYPVLLEHNPDLAIYDIGQKDRIAILQDNEQVKRIYNEITEFRGGVLYWYYTVRRGDTLASLKHRYCPSRNCFQIRAGLDPDSGLQPGEKMKIQLSGVSE